MVDDSIHFIWLPPPRKPKTQDTDHLSKDGNWAILIEVFNRRYRCGEIDRKVVSVYGISTVDLTGVTHSCEEFDQLYEHQFNWKMYGTSDKQKVTCTGCINKFRDGIISQLTQDINAQHLEQNTN